MSEAIPGMPEAPPPAEPKDAAVVVLVRMGPRGLEVFWLRRERTALLRRRLLRLPRRAGGRGATPQVPVEGAGPPDARLVAAAARELFEETGVLAARGRTPDAPDAGAAARAALLEGKAHVRRGCSTAHGLPLDALDFEPAGRWVTPPFMPVRFDARFFLVEVPPGTRAEVWPGEAAEGSWVRPTDALTRWQEGTALLHPPNRHALQVLGRVRRTVDAVAWLAARRPRRTSSPAHRVPARRAHGAAADADAAARHAHQRVRARHGELLDRGPGRAGCRRRSTG